MLKAIIGFAGAGVLFLIGLGFEVSPLQSWWLSAPIWCVAGLWGLVWIVAWRGLSWRSPLQSPIYAPSANNPQPSADAMLPDDPVELIQFANSAFVPAWQAMIQLCADTRALIAKKEGARIEGMFQEIMERGGEAWRRFDARLREGRGDATLDEALAGAYQMYELQVRWIQQGGEPHGFPSPDDKHLAEWHRTDARLLDKLTDLIALPAFSQSALALRRQQACDSGIPQIIREKLVPKAGLPARPAIRVSRAEELPNPVGYYVVEQDGTRTKTADNYFCHIYFVNEPDDPRPEACAEAVTAKLALFYGPELAFEWWGKWRGTDDIAPDMRPLRQTRIDPDGQEAALDVTLRNEGAYTVYGYNHDNLLDRHGFDEKKVIKPGSHRLRVTLQGINLPQSEYWFSLECRGPKIPVLITPH